jgi:EAL domain-containing protein (putative c-di-GMP-specific phosphodiesterase class I)
LLRWRHPQRGLLAPATFIDSLANSPVALEVGSWILQTACEAAARWSADGLPAIRMGVNLFPQQFRENGLLENVRAALQKSGLPPVALELEITENIALGGDEATLARLRALREIGVGLAFDDFGTGYASLSHLTRYPLTRIKIDRSFVEKIASPSTAIDTAIVRSIIAMGHNLGLEVIAEGVETPEQAAFLQARRCEEAQGYLYAKPMPEADFAQFLALQRDNSHCLKARGRLIG